MPETKLRLRPSLDEYEKCAKETPLIAVSTEISIDLDTPVSIYYKLVGDAKGFLLESVDTSSQTLARYSFIRSMSESSVCLSFAPLLYHEAENE